MKISFGIKLKAYRVKRNMSQMALELETGCAFGVISRFEKDKVIPNLVTLNRISKALQLSDKEFVEIWRLNIN